jgi:hypothetical protein
MTGDAAFFKRDSAVMEGPEWMGVSGGGYVGAEEMKRCPGRDVKWSCGGRASVV